MTETFNAAEGRPVVAGDTAEDIGEVKGFVLGPDASSIEAVHVSGKGRKAEVVAWSNIRSFGTGVVVVERASAPERPATDHATDAVKGKTAPRGARLLLTTGFEAGTVSDVEFDPDTGHVVSVATDQGTVDVKRLRSLGSYALVIEPEA